MKIDQAVDIYLEAVDAHLSVPAPVRHRVLEEIRGHLMDAINDASRRGLDQDDAAQRAIRDFGPPDAVASQFDDLGAPTTGKTVTMNRSRSSTDRDRSWVLLIVLSIPLLVDLSFWLRTNSVPLLVANGREKDGLGLVCDTLIHLALASCLWWLHKTRPTSNRVVLLGGAAYLVVSFFSPLLTRQIA